MAKSARAGEMRTRITVKRMKAGLDQDGIATEHWIDVFNGMTRCKWVYAHGAEVYDGMRLDLGQMATITMRYTPLIDERCRVWRENEPQDDAHGWDVVSVNVPEDRRSFLDIQLKRTVVA